MTDDGLKNRCRGGGLVPLGWSIKFMTGVKNKGQRERTRKVRELGGEGKEWNSFRNKKQIEMQWIGGSVPDITHVRNSAAHIFTIFWWETNGEEQNSRKAELGLSGAPCEFYHRLQHREQNDGVTVVCAVSPLHSPPCFDLNFCLDHVWPPADSFARFFPPGILWLIRTSAGRDVWATKNALKQNKDFTNFIIIKNRNLKILLCQNHFLSVSITEAFHLLPLPFSSYEKAVSKCFHITSSFHYGKPRHSSSGISLFLVCTLSTPVHPGIETAWAGMENPTSVQTEAHCSLALQFGQCGAPNWSLSGEFNVHPPSLFLHLHLLCPFNISQPETFTFETRSVEVQ